LRYINENIWNNVIFNLKLIIEAIENCYVILVYDYAVKGQADTV